MTRRAGVFLDRDGVLNEATVRDGTPASPRRAADFRLLPGVAEACSALSAAGLCLVVVTNQPDVGRGLLDPAELDAMHELMLRELPIDDVVVCTHGGTEGCWCRKPRPGMVLDAARRLDLDLDRSVCVGDRWRDVEAARRAGVHAVHIDWGHGEPLRDSPDASFGSLLEAKDHVLQHTTADHRAAAIDQR